MTRTTLLSLCTSVWLSASVWLWHEDGGRFAVKRTIGESIRVTADIFADGHDVIVAVLRYRATSADHVGGPAAAERQSERPRPTTSGQTTR